MPVIIGPKLADPKNPKPLSGFPHGKVRIKFRPDDITRAYVWNPDSIEEYAVQDSGDTWTPAFLMRATYHQKNNHE